MAETAEERVQGAGSRPRRAGLQGAEQRGQRVPSCLAVDLELLGLLELLHRRDRAGVVRAGDLRAVPRGLEQVLQRSHPEAAVTGEEHQFDRDDVVVGEVIGGDQALQGRGVGSGLLRLDDLRELVHEARNARHRRAGALVGGVAGDRRGVRAEGVGHGTEGGVLGAADRDAANLVGLGGRRRHPVPSGQRELRVAAQSRVVRPLLPVAQGGLHDTGRVSTGLDDLPVPVGLLLGQDGDVADAVRPRRVVAEEDQVSDLR